MIKKTALVAALMAVSVIAQAQTAAAPASPATNAMTASQQAPAAATPSDFIVQLSRTALMSLTAKNIPRSEREARVREILHDNFDVQAIGKFAMGTSWRQATEQQRQEYLNLFENMIVQTYTTRFEEYSGQQLKVTGAQQAGPQDTLVSSQILQKDGPPINIQWRVRNAESKLRVVDVLVDNISMSVTQRSDFAAIAQKGGIEGLLQSMREHQQLAKTK